MNKMSRDYKSGGFPFPGTRKNKGSTSSIPRTSSSSAALTLSTKEYRWLQGEAWGEAEITYFHSHWPTPRTGLSHSPAFVRGQNNRQKLVFLGRWMLSKADDTKVAAVELEGLFSSFSQVALRVGACSGTNTWTHPNQAEALAHLISAVIMIFKADFIRLIPMTEGVSRQLAELGWGGESSLWTPDLRYIAGAQYHTPAATIRVRAIDPEAWWQSEEGKKGHRALSYLEKRISLAALQEKSCETRRPGFFQRLGKLIRWN